VGERLSVAFSVLEGGRGLARRGDRRNGEDRVGVESGANVDRDHGGSHPSGRGQRTPRRRAGRRAERRAGTCEVDRLGRPGRPRLGL